MAGFRGIAAVVFALMTLTGPTTAGPIGPAGLPESLPATPVSGPLTPADAGDVSEVDDLAEPVATTRRQGGASTSRPKVAAVVAQPRPLPRSRAAIPPRDVFILLQRFLC